MVRGLNRVPNSATIGCLARRSERPAAEREQPMKIVPLNEVKNRFSTYLELSKREDIVVTKNGRPAAILHAVTDEDLEDYLFESDPRFIARIEALRREFQRGGGTPLADVRRELRVPASRRRGAAPRRRRTSPVA
jgi:prevent-host-death family protein